MKSEKGCKRTAIIYDEVKMICGHKIIIMQAFLVFCFWFVFGMKTADSDSDTAEETTALMQDDSECTEEAALMREHAESTEEAAVVVDGTWRNMPDAEADDWKTTYRTRFSPDGQVVHYGSRNVDFGRWERIGDTITAYFDNCYYLGISGQIYMLPAFDVTYRYQEVLVDGRTEMVLERSTDRKAEIQVEVETEQGTENDIATDFDDYELPLYYESDFSRFYGEYYGYCDFPKVYKNNEMVREGLLELAEVMLMGGEAKLERADLPYTLDRFSTYDITGDGREEIFAYVEAVWQMYEENEGAIYIISPVNEDDYVILAENIDFRRGFTDILVPDGTEVFSQDTYFSASSWKGGIRIHLGYRDGQIVVDKEESYGFHWDYPLINYVNDYRNGKYYVYVARSPDEGTGNYGSYVEIEDSIKIDEEDFESVFLTFNGFEPRSNDYPAVYFSFHPFPEGWWQDGGRYPEDGEDYYGAGMAYWIDAAADDDPDEMLKEAVENSGYEMERVAYPWTAETKANVMKLLRCPVADYYYISEDYAAYYARGYVRCMEF